MNLSRKIIGAALMLATSSAFALPTFSAPGIGAGSQAFDPFGGFDWASNGTAYTNDFNAQAAFAGTAFSFNMTYFAYAVPTSGILKAGGGNFSVLNLSGGADTSAVSNAPPLDTFGFDDFEITVVAHLNETATCTGFGASCDFSVNTGSFEIWLDRSPDAKAGGAGAALSDFQNGELLISGILGNQPGGNFSATSGSGVNTLFALVTYTNTAYINPVLLGSTATTTLQFGAAITDWTRPTGVVGAADTCALGPTGSTASLCTFQADANQTFTYARVPEPGSLALAGLAMVAAGAAGRSLRKKAA